MSNINIEYEKYIDRTCFFRVRKKLIVPIFSFSKAIISQQCESCGRHQNAGRSATPEIEFEIGDHCFEMCEEDNQDGLTWNEVENCEVGT